MQKTISVTELQQQLHAVLDEVAREETCYVLTKSGRPQVALIPYEDFQRLLKLREQDVLARFDRLVERMAAENARYSEAEVSEDIEAASKQ